MLQVMVACLLAVGIPPTCANYCPQSDDTGAVVVKYALQNKSQRRASEEDKEKARIRIGITKEQQNHIEALYQETDQQIQAIQAKIRDLYHQLYTLYEDYDYDRNQARFLRKELVNERRKMLDLHAVNEEKLRHILNKDQFEKMRALLKEEMEKHRQERKQREHNPSGT